MRKEIFALAVSLSASVAPAADFNFAAYSPASVSEITERWNGVTKGYTPGLSVKTPEKIAVAVIAMGPPYPCDNKVLAMVFNSLVMPDFLKQVPINHCIAVKTSATAQEFFAHIQDALVPSYVAEVKPGTKVRLYAGFLAYAVSQDTARNFPLLVVNEFQAQ